MQKNLGRGFGGQMLFLERKIRKIPIPFRHPHKIDRCDQLPLVSFTVVTFCALCCPSVHPQPNYTPIHNRGAGESGLGIFGWWRRVLFDE